MLLFWATLLNCSLLCNQISSFNKVFIKWCTMSEPDKKKIKTIKMIIYGTCHTCLMSLIVCHIFKQQHQVYTNILYSGILCTRNDVCEYLFINSPAFKLFIIYIFIIIYFQLIELIKDSCYANIVWRSFIQLISRLAE